MVGWTEHREAQSGGDKNVSMLLGWGGERKGESMCVWGGGGVEGGGGGERGRGWEKEGGRRKKEEREEKEEGEEKGKKKGGEQLRDNFHFSVKAGNQPH